MKSHFVMMIVFSVLTSLVLTFLVKSGLKERLKYFFYLLGSFVLLSLVASWLMYPFPLR